ncbi:MAG: FKBP-type peptidyl-prolyl cis-trans isomerase [Candidatus Paceibacterota bacterium]
MKKTLFPLLLLYIGVIVVGLFFRERVYQENGTLDYNSEAKLRKQQMLEKSFIIQNNSEDPQFSLDVLKITSYVLVTNDVKVGGGVTAEVGDVITIHYKAMFEDGTVFDSSRSLGRSPFQFKLGAGQAIAGWDQGIPGMRVGGIRTLRVPPASAYGMSDYGSIPGGSTLLYEIELLSVFE